MEPDMQYLRAPQENLQTWKSVVKLFLVSTIAIVVLLIVLAATLL